MFEFAIIWKLVILTFLVTPACSKVSDTPIGNGYRSVVYFGNWAVKANFTPQDMPANSLTHVLYAFANVNPTSGEIFLSDPLTDTGNDNLLSNNTLHGYLEQLYLLKQQHRNLKVLLSIGGQNYSSNFAPPLNSSGPSAFASSVVFNVQTFGFDGVDIDWQYPADQSQANDMVLLLKAVREALDAYGESLAYNFTLSVACPGPFGYDQLHLADMDPHVDFWNLMAYDYVGGWSDVTGDQANLFYSPSNPASTPFSTESIVNYYTSQGIAAAKIVLGMPLYGTAFNNTANMLGEPFNGITTYSVKDLPLNGAVEYYNSSTGSCYSYDPLQKQLVSYDSVTVANQKAAWIRDMGLGGAMFWESSEDGTGSQSIIQSVALVLAGNDVAGLDSTQNQLLYPDSIYSNLRSGVPASSASTPTTSSSSVRITPTSSVSTQSPLVVITPISSVSTQIPTVIHTSLACFGQVAAGVGHRC